jgi:hypothetical protein
MRHTGRISHCVDVQGRQLAALRVRRRSAAK